MSLWQPVPQERTARSLATVLGRWNARQLFVLSFLGMIAVGTIGYLVLPGLYEGEPLTFIDALFTATSAVCVTGLIVVDTASHFTIWGQAWTLLLIQVGGLGMLTFATLVVISISGRGSLVMEEASASQATHLKHTSTARLITSVLVLTLLLEGIGTLVLWAAWSGIPGLEPVVWHALFNAVSAFCNAGFSTFPDSMVGFHDSPVTLATICCLIVVGGLGFVSLADLEARRSGRTRRLTVHTRLVLYATATLLAAGTALFLLFEWNRGFSGLSLASRFMNAFFMSVTPRTAGFNTVDYGAVTNESMFLTVILMLIGGSPGSTAGGFKTTTVAILVLLLFAKLRGDERVSIFGRSLPEATVQRASGMIVGGIFVLAISIFLLSVTEFQVASEVNRSRFVAIVFEAHSAFGTVGLSMGATPELSAAGRLVISVLMFLGRVGPLAAVSAMAVPLARKSVHYRYGEEDVIIG